ncbi:unnamed protein product [Clonostachys chloroleuca]|uniref:Uncharacterized protein n=1 Tax=Clonostachys chloroleuca TaxID=1926264 RepID=A0AA35MHC3_9HYPO|nr:unnamed protein product [Clonostachys chloroleuca]
MARNCTTIRAQPSKESPTMVIYLTTCESRSFSRFTAPCTETHDVVPWRLRRAASSDRSGHGRFDQHDGAWWLLLRRAMQSHPGDKFAINKVQGWEEKIRE